MLLCVGFLNNISTIALAVGSHTLSTGSISAADLGASCCADLKERIAELEATTALKGNRKMSPTISGFIYRVVLWWDDGRSSGTYYGLDSRNNPSRLLFSGSAKMTPKATTGFEFMIDARGPGTTASASQLHEDGKLTSFIPNVNSGATGPIGIPSLNAHNADAFFGEGRAMQTRAELYELIGFKDFESLDASIVETIVPSLS